jgi:predicted glycoside hydrolase/deacetylase ChbG (UPF0249 family)
LKIRVHADDLGASEGISTEIIRCADDGALDSASLLVNAPAFEFALREYRKRRNFSLALHVNLIEGPPLTPPSQMTHLVNGEGLFRHTATSLWTTWLRSSPSTRRQLQDQTRLEIAAQLELFRDSLAGESDGRDEQIPSIELDSHGHSHLVPFVFNEVLSLAREHGIARIRVLNEPLRCVGVPASPGALVRGIKSMALTHLSGHHAARLEQECLLYPRFVLGIADGGRMTLASVARGLAVIHAAGGADAAEVELIFHPGGTDASEDWAWAHYRSYGRFYRSVWRQRESELLKSEELAELLRGYQSERT